MRCRCRKEQERELRQYVPRLLLYFKGSEAMQRTLAEVQQIVELQRQRQQAGGAAGAEAAPQAGAAEAAAAGAPQ